MGIFLKDINLKGKTALITGATKGLGRGAALAIDRFLEGQSTLSAPMLKLGSLRS